MKAFQQSIPVLAKRHHTHAKIHGFNYQKTIHALHYLYYFLHVDLIEKKLFENLYYWCYV